MKFRAEKIRDAREGAGLTQERLAHLIGRTLGSVREWEAGKRAPKATDLAGIMSATGTEPAFYFELTPDPSGRVGLKRSGGTRGGSERG